MNRIENQRDFANETQVINRKNIKRKKRNNKKKDIILIAIIMVIGVTILSFLFLGFKALISSVEPKELKDDSSFSSSVLGDYSNLNMLEFADEVSRRDVAPYLMLPNPSPAVAASIEGKNVGIYGAMLTVGDAGYEYYKFNQTTGDNFIKALNTSIEKMPPEVEIFTMIVPSSIDIMLPLSFLHEHASRTSDQEKSIKYFNHGISDKAIALDIYPMMKAYCNQNIYMKRHNSWTSLGAYYASTIWKSANGFEVPKISSYRKGTAGEMKGYISSFVGSKELSGLEVVEYYIPGSDLKITEYQNPDSAQSSIFTDVSKTNRKLNAFLGGKRALTEITNSTVTDNSTVVIVGDSLSYQLAPYIAENYKKTYLIDYTEYSGDLAEFVKTVSAEDVLYCFDIDVTLSDEKISQID